jgi:hypothetical protein
MVTSPVIYGILSVMFIRPQRTVVVKFYSLVVMK